MAQCVTATVDQNGTVILQIDAQTDLQQCQIVLQTGVEVGNSLAFFTPAEAVEISTSVALLWAMAWGIKQVARVLKETQNETE